MGTALHIIEPRRNAGLARSRWSRIVGSLLASGALLVGACDAASLDDDATSSEATDSPSTPESESPVLAQNIVSAWEQLDDNPETTAIATNMIGEVFQLHRSGAIFYMVNDARRWLQLDDNPNTVKIVAASKLYQLHRDGAIFRFQGPPGPPFEGKWVQLDDNPGTVDIVADGADLYQLQRNGSIWKFVGPPGPPFAGKWKKLDGNSQTIKIAATNGQRLYQLQRDGAIYAYENGKWVSRSDIVPTPSVDIVADGADLYRLTPDGRVLKYTGGSDNWLDFEVWGLIDHDPANVQIAVSWGDLFIRKRDGRIWMIDGMRWPNAIEWRLLDDNPETAQVVGNGLHTVYQVHRGGAIFRKQY